MADAVKTILSLCATTSSRLPELAIKNGQLIFVQDIKRIAMDLNGKRTFYNQLEELQTDAERESIESPVNGLFYFVIDTAVLWRYQDKWIPVTTPPGDIVFIGTELPELGSANKLYIDKLNKEVSIWDDEGKQYIVVANKVEEISEEFIDSLFQ